MTDFATIYWRRQALLKREVDALTERIAMLENGMPSGKSGKRMSLTRAARTASAWMSVASSAHTLWPLLAAGIGVAWKIAAHLLGS